MYIDYGKLWKLLIDKNMSKADLMEITGLSSRVLAKLSKNETVSTDTIVRICSALDCDVSDIMECVSDENLSVYGAYKKQGLCTAEEETVKTVQFTLADRKYTVYQSIQTANKATQILCEGDGTVYWVQFHAVGYVTIPEKSILVKPCRNKEETVIVLIKGKPSVIAGLDENGFVSSRGVPKSEGDVYVMSEAAFKIFTPKS